jgi:NAD(P)-dependent dehydrogenase (short-subunit alcohol dehydrogenase family)
MQNQTVIVTGASTGIGKAIARLFLEKGHNVVLNARDEDQLRHSIAGLGNPANAVAVAGDVGNAATGQLLVETALQQFGRLDVLVNNAGVFAPKPFLDVAESDLEYFLAVNLKGTFFTTQAAIRAMLPKGGGSIVNIGTVLVDHAIAGFPASAPVSSKGGIHALTRQLAAEFGGHNIRVNTIAPGIIRSPLQAKIGVDNADSLAGLHLLQRIGEPADIAEMTYFLATSAFITGEILNVDGGHVAGHRFA